MKFNSKKAITLLAVAGLAFASTAVHAATTAYTTGDLILGFRQTGATSSLLVNIGQAGGYRDGTTTGNLSLGNLGADLTSLFGSGWSSDATVFWGVVGTPGSASFNSDPGNTLYATKPEGTFGVQEAAYERLSSATQGNGRSNIVSMATAYAGKTSTTNSDVALAQLNTATNSWSSFNPGGTSFSYFSGMEGNFGSGVASSALDLFRMTPDSLAAVNFGNYEGSLTINSSGVVNFGLTTPGAVPEPGRAALMGLGLGGFLLRRRRPAAAV